MKKYTIYNRYGYKHVAKLVNEDTIHFYCDKKSQYCSIMQDTSSLAQDNLNKKGSKITGFDPEGGPFIAVWETAQHAIHSELPNREIIKIIEGKGYYIISLRHYKKPIIRQQKILKLNRNN